MWDLLDVCFDGRSYSPFDDIRGCHARDFEADLAFVQACVNCIVLFCVR